MSKKRKAGENHKKVRTKKAPKRAKAAAAQPPAKGYCPNWSDEQQAKIVGVSLALETARGEERDAAERLKLKRAAVTELEARLCVLTRPTPEIDKRGQRNMYPDAKGVDESAPAPEAPAPAAPADGKGEAWDEAQSGPVRLESKLAHLNLSGDATEALYNAGCRTVKDLVDVMVSHHKRGEDWRGYFKKLDAESADKILRTLHNAQMLPKKFPRPGEVFKPRLVGGTAKAQ